MDGIVSINGDIVPVSQAKISVLDRGFLFGDAIFEVIVGFDKKLLLLDEHILRLRYSGKSIGFELPWTDEDIRKEVLEVYKHTHFPKTYLRIGVTRGEGLGIVPKSAQYNKLIYSLPSPVSSPHIYTEGLRLKTQSKKSTIRGPSIKNPFYLPSIVSMIDLKDKYDDLVWVNSDQEITESSTSNIFFIGREGSSLFVETPSLESGLLSGITRDLVIKLLKKNGVEVRECSILENELARYDEAFLSSTIRGLVPVRQIDDKTFNSVRTSSLFHKINQFFKDWVDGEVGKRCEWNI